MHLGSKIIPARRVSPYAFMIGVEGERPAINQVEFYSQQKKVRTESVFLEYVDQSSQIKAFLETSDEELTKQLTHCFTQDDSELTDSKLSHILNTAS